MNRGSTFVHKPFNINFTNMEIEGVDKFNVSRQNISGKKMAMVFIGDVIIKWRVGLQKTLFRA